MSEGAIHTPALSIVVPFYDEEANATALAAELRAEVEEQGWDAEAIFVDDGSTDGTGATLDRAAAEWPACRVIHFPHNCGQAAALWHGLHAARAPIVATLDGDGQSVPADLAALLPLLEEADLVVGWRKQRNDSWLRRAMSRTANGVRGRFMGDGLHDIGCATKIMRREVIGSLLPIRSLYSFLPAMAAAAGYRLAERPVQHRARQGGRSKYGFLVMAWRPLLDMLALKWILTRRIPHTD